MHIEVIMHKVPRKSPPLSPITIRGGESFIRPDRDMEVIWEVPGLKQTGEVLVCSGTAEYIRRYETEKVQKKASGRAKEIGKGRGMGDR